jgi:hypothetical protein
MIISIKDAWDDARELHKAYFKGIVDGALAEVGTSQIKSPLLKDLLVASWKELATGSPAQLRAIITLVKSQLSGMSGEEREEFTSEAKRICDYKKFSASTSLTWSAYSLCKTSRHTLCPYCHQAYAFTVERVPGGKGFRPTLDHFYPQHAYPYLALSLYNLVPSCYVCNSSLKGKTDFFATPHLHPFEDEEMVHFTFDVDTYLLFRGAPAAQFKMTAGEVLDPKHAVKAQATVKTFALNDRYAFHFDDLARFAQSVLFVKSDEAIELFDRLKAKAGEDVLLNFCRGRYKFEMLGGIKRDIYDLLVVGDGSAAWPGL